MLNKKKVFKMKQQITVKYKKWVVGVLGIFILVALLLSNNTFANFVAGIFKKNESEKSLLAAKIVTTAKMLLYVGVGSVLLTVAVSLMAIPIVGLSIGLVGISLIYSSLSPFIKSMKNDIQKDKDFGINPTN